MDTFTCQKESVCVSEMISISTYPFRSDHTFVPIQHFPIRNRIRYAVRLNKEYPILGLSDKMWQRLGVHTCCYHQLDVACGGACAVVNHGHQVGSESEGV